MASGLLIFLPGLIAGGLLLLLLHGNESKTRNDRILWFLFALFFPIFAIPLFLRQGKKGFFAFAGYLIAASIVWFIAFGITLSILDPSFKEGMKADIAAQKIEDQKKEMEKKKLEQEEIEKKKLVEKAQALMQAEVGKQKKVNAEVIQKLRNKGVITKLDCELSEAYVRPFDWVTSDFETKKNFTETLMSHCESQYFNVKSSMTGKEIGHLGAWGFEVK